MSIPPSHDPRRASLGLEALREDGQWLVRLARAITADPAAAEDAAQVALIRGWRERAVGRPAPRAWLKSVMVSALRREQRGEGRRGRREERAALSERMEDPGGLDALERLELQRAAIDALVSLDEPYRSALVAQFLEGLSAREIAERDGVPVKTVQTRLRRGLDRVREDLGRRGSESQGGPEWLAGLAWVASYDGAGPAAGLSAGVSAGPSAGPSSGATAAALNAGAQGAAGALIVSAGTKFGLGAVALAMALGGVMLIKRVGARSTPVTVSPIASAEGTDLEPVVTAPMSEAGPESDMERVSVGHAAPEPPPLSEPEDEVALPNPSLRSGVVLALDGDPMPEFPLEVIDPGRGGAVVTSVKTRSDGTFELGATVEGRLQSGSEQHTLVFDYRLRAKGPQELRLMALPAADLAGIVVDETGSVVAGAEVEVRVGGGVLFQSTSGDWQAADPERATVTAADGTFSLKRVPCDASSRLHASAPGYAATVLPVPESGDAGLVIRLLKPQAAEHAVAGRVINAEGLPVEGAWVSAGEGGASVQTDEEGRFVAAYDPEATPETTTVRAISRGCLPAEEPLLRSERGPITLTVGAPALGISGVVVDSDGSPLESASVWLGGLKPFGGMQQNSGGITFLMSVDFEEIMATESVPLGAWNLESDGRFSIPGLRDSAYTLYAVDRDSLRMVSLPDVAAGSHGVVVTMPPMAPAPERAPLAGRVVDGFGEPVLDTTVQVELVHGTGNAQVRLGPSCQTDAEGSFRFEGLIPTALRLTASSHADGFQPGTIELAEGDFGDDLEIALHRTFRAHFFSEDPRFASGLLSLLDEDGQPLRVSLRVSTVTLLTHGTTLEEGRSSVIVFDDRARVARLRGENGETLDVTLDLDPTALNEVELR